MKHLSLALTTAALPLLAGACHGVLSPTARDTSAALTPQPTPTAATPPIAAFPQYPTLSPDGQTLVFSSGGDLWAARLSPPGTLPISVVATARLTAHPAEERRSAFSTDQQMLAFESNRDGARNLYVMPLRWGLVAGRPTVEGNWLSTGPATRVTFSDAAQTLGGFSVDNRSLFFSASQEPTIYRQARLYRAPIDGGPAVRITDAYGFLPRPTADGSSVIFTRGYSNALERPAYRGSGNMDLFQLSLKDGTFTRLTADMANDLDAQTTTDGTTYFLSSRSGQYNLYKLDAGKTDQTSQPSVVTSVGIPAGTPTIGHGIHDLAVASSGSRAAFTLWDTMYVVDLTSVGPKPQALSIPLDADTAQLDTQRLNLDKSVSEAALSPDGKTMAVIARGEVFVRSTEEGRPTRRVTETPGRERDLAWSPDGKTLYFSSDQTGVYALYGATVALSREDIEPKDKPAKKTEPAPAAPAEAKPADPKPGEPPAPAGATPPADATKPATDADKDAKKEPKTDEGKRWSESLLFEVKPLLMPATVDQRNPVPSPDGKKLIYTKALGDIMLVDLATLKERLVAPSWNEPEVIWAADSKHIIYSMSDLDYNSDLWLVDAEAAATALETKAANPAINLTQHPDNDVSPRLSADGKVLTFLSERAGDNGEFDVWQVYLDKKLEGLKSYELDEYYKKAAESAGKRKPIGAPADKKPDASAKDDGKKTDVKKETEEKSEAKPMTFDAQDAYLRVRRVTSSHVAEGELMVTPGADRILFSAAIDAERSLYSIDRKGEDRKVLQAGSVTGLGMSLTGDKVSFVRAGSVFTTSPKGGGKVEALPIDAPVTLDVAQQQRQKFLEAARILGTRFYHPTLKGLDWPALTNRYLELAMKTRTNEEFDRVVEMLFGELEGSHVGIMSGPTYTTTRPAIGQLGVRTEPVADGFLVKSVVTGSPADQRSSKLEVGDVIVGIDGKTVAEGRPVRDLGSWMLGRAGKETLLEVRKGAPAEGEPATRHVLIVPTTSAALTDLSYQDEVLKRREQVEKLSGGKLGYLHIRAMGDASVRDFERDLYAAAHDKSGLVIDVRDNGGGYTTDILLSSLTAPVHAKTFPRGVDPDKVPADAYPRDRRLIYAYTRPINVLINENSFSNAEVFAHAIHNIKRGTLVGTPTFGGVISTGAATLLDGATVRVPGRGWIMPDGNDMENHGAVPDVSVPQRPDDEAAGRDPQLEAAVKELLGRVQK